LHFGHVFSLEREKGFGTNPAPARFFPGTDFSRPDFCFPLVIGSRAVCRHLGPGGFSFLALLRLVAIVFQPSEPASGKEAG
jgi:hypothetical protein